MEDLIHQPEFWTAIGILLPLVLPKSVLRYLPLIKLLVEALEAFREERKEEAVSKRWHTVHDAAWAAVQGALQLKRNGQLDDQAAQAYAMAFLTRNFGLDEGTAELLVEGVLKQLK